MLLFHEVCHSSKIYLLIDGLKLENGILKEVGSNESDVFACSWFQCHQLSSITHDRHKRYKIPLIILLIWYLT